MALTDVKAKQIKPGDKALADGTVTGLLLIPGSERGHAKWQLRFVSPVTKARRNYGLGTYPNVSIAEAREAARDARANIAKGGDPIETRRAEVAAREEAQNILTFEQAARKVHAEQAPGFRNAKHRDQWLNTLRDYIFPSLGAVRLPDLRVSNFAEALRPIWMEKVETAGRVRQRCHVVMSWAQAHGIIDSNPVDALDHLLPKRPRKRERVEHHPAMAWQKVPEFVQGTLRAGHENVTKSLLEFVILTCVRSGEARGMRFDEVDFDARLWTVPGSRMRAKVAHSVPLSDRVIEIIQEQRRRNPQKELAFPSPSKGVACTDMILTKFLRDNNVASTTKGRIATAHGFRSSFRDWAGEKGYERDLAEKVLAHTLANQTEAAYFRSSLLEQRRKLMQTWSDFVCGKELATNVLPLQALG